MIFVTVGVQLPFDRLIRAVDTWAYDTKRGDVVAQVGKSDYTPKCIKTFERLTAVDFHRYSAAADLIVAHAGMGSIVTGLELGKRILVMPRMAALNEHRNDHQLTSAQRMTEKGFVVVAKDAGELQLKLTELSSVGSQEHRPIAPYANADLLARVSSFVDEVARSKARGRFQKI